MIPNSYWMIVISGSGKTTKAEQLVKEGKAHTIISSDAIRKELYGDENIQINPDKVFELVHKRCRDCLKVGMSVVYDATNLSFRYRKKFFTYLLEHNVIANHHAIVKCTPLKIAHYNNENRERVVPKEVIDKQFKKFQIPFWEEGFKTITLEDGTNYFSEVSPDDNRQHPYNEDNFQSLLGLMKNFNQNNSHHAFSLLEHCDKVYENICEYSDDKALVVASQIHDIGKRYTATIDENGENHYYSHAEAGCYSLLSNLDCLNLNVSEVIKCLFYVCYHMRPFSWVADKTKDKYRKIFGAEKYNNLWLLHKSDIKGCK